MSAPRSKAVRLLAVVVAVAATTAVAVAVWNTQNHEARIGLAWAISGLVVSVVTWRDVRSRPSAPLRTSLVIATGWLYFVGFLTVMVLIFGWIFAFFGVVFGIPATALAWLARNRLLQGRPDGALLTFGMLVATGSFALSRPWTPKSSMWVWGAGVAFAASALVLGDLFIRAARQAKAVNQPLAPAGRGR